MELMGVLWQNHNIYRYNVILYLFRVNRRRLSLIIIALFNGHYLIIIDLSKVQNIIYVCIIKYELLIYYIKKKTQVIAFVRGHHVKE